MDLDLIAELAKARPNWHIVMLGPVVKIELNQLPSASNIHYLGSKQYAELPAYLGSWDIGLLPFALNDSTRFISPTKTPEYLAAGLPVVSTAIRDVQMPYGVEGLVRIAGDSAEMITAIEESLPGRHSQKRLQRVDKFLSSSSWDLTWRGMAELIVTAASKPKVQNIKAIKSRLKHLTSASLIGATEIGGV